MTSIAIISIVVALIPFVVSAIRGRPDFFSPLSIFAFGYSAGYGLKAWLMTLDPRLYVTYPEKTQDLSLVLPIAALTWAALLTLYAGYYLAQDRWSWLLPAYNFSERELRVAKTVALVSVGLGLLSMIALVVLTGVSNWFSSIEFAEDIRATMMLAWAEHPMLYHFPLWTGFFGLAAIHAHVTLRRFETTTPTAQRRSSFIVVTVGICVISLALLGSRALLLSFVLSLFLYRHYYYRRIRPWTQALLLLTLVLVGGYFGIIQKLQGAGRTAMELPFPFNIAYRLSSSYEQFENLVNIINLNPPLEWGRTFVEDVFVPFIPRVLWPNKPLVYGFLRAQNYLFEDYWYQSTDTTYPIGILGELYLNFGMTGIFGGMFGVGVFLARIRALSANPSSPYATILCVLGATFLSPQRFFGTILLSVCLYLFFYAVVSMLSKITAPGTPRVFLEGKRDRAIVDGRGARRDQGRS
jgi:hypothetical protein